MAYIYHLLHKIFSTDNYLIKTALGLWLYFEGIHNYIYYIIIFIILDSVTGIAASIKLGKKFTSECLRKGLLEKTALYLILILSGFLLESIFKSIFPYQNYYIGCIITTLICSYESVSVMENILIIDPELTFLTALIRLAKRISNMTIKTADDKLDKMDEIMKDDKKETESTSSNIPS
ncbi:MAG: phage holin family protein [Bacteroidota bacterium]|nr:phage holin family protein [Bacteroidota bacterium]